MCNAGSTAALAQSKLDAAYTATLLSLPIGEISWTVRLQNNQFVAQASGAISGFLRLFLDARGQAVASGALPGGKPAVANFSLKIDAGKWSDNIRILFRGNKAEEYITATPAKPNPNVVPITAASRIGVVDPMTALLVYVPGNGDTVVRDACERTVPVFDGRTRYNLELTFKRFDQARTDRGYQGPVVICSARFLPVAGYDPKHFLIAHLTAERDVEIWLAPLTGSRLIVPYRLTIPTPLGLGVLQATRFETL